MAEYTVHDVRERHELDSVVDVIWKAQYDPYLPSSSILFPIFGSTDDDRARAIAASKDRLWNEHSNDTSGNRGWMYVRYQNEEIIAGAQWERHGGSPFPNGCPKLNIYWWPEGEGKRFCQEIMQQIYTPRSLWMQRAHGGINAMVVHPRHRNRGVGGLMLQSSNLRLDQEGIEGFLEASDLGRRCYEKYGYQVLMRIDLFLPSGKGDEWQKYFHDLKPNAWYAMWRPARGDKSGRTKPWQLGPSLPV